MNENPTMPKPITTVTDNKPKNTAQAPLASNTRVTGGIPKTGSIPTTPTPIRPVARRR